MAIFCLDKPLRHVEPRVPTCEVAVIKGHEQRVESM